MNGGGPERSRRAEGMAAKTYLETDPSGDQRQIGDTGLDRRRWGDSTPVQLRRRREASYRLPPLACGDRDPLLCDHRDDVPRLADYCCSGLGVDQAAALARLGGRCTATTCARLAAS